MSCSSKGWCRWPRSPTTTICITKTRGRLSGNGRASRIPSAIRSEFSSIASTTCRSGCSLGCWKRLRCQKGANARRKGKHSSCRIGFPLQGECHESLAAAFGRIGRGCGTRCGTNLRARRVHPGTQERGERQQGASYRDEHGHLAAGRGERDGCVAVLEDPFAPTRAASLLCSPFLLGSVHGAASAHFHQGHLRRFRAAHQEAARRG